MSTSSIAKITVKNVPEYAKEKKYWVVSFVDHEFWFYTAWDKKEDIPDIEEDFRLVVENLDNMEV